MPLFSHSTRNNCRFVPLMHLHLNQRQIAYNQTSNVSHLLFTPCASLPKPNERDALLMSRICHFKHVTQGSCNGTNNNQQSIIITYIFKMTKHAKCANTELQEFEHNRAEITRSNMHNIFFLLLWTL